MLDSIKENNLDQPPNVNLNQSPNIKNTPNINTPQNITLNSNLNDTSSSQPLLDRHSAQSPINNFHITTPPPFQLTSTPTSDLPPTQPPPQYSTSISHKNKLPKLFLKYSPLSTITQSIDQNPKYNYQSSSPNNNNGQLISPPNS